MSLHNLKTILLSVLAIFIICHSVLSIEVEKELIVTNKEKMGLDMLKMRVMNVPAHNWLKSDLALLRWLRIKDLNVDAAEKAFHENIKWRKENNIDTIVQEDWSRFKDEYLFDCTATDFSGRPVCSGDISEWDVRGAVLAGHGEKLVRYMMYTVELASTRVRASQEMGLNVTQWQTIMNMDNFNLHQHGCVQCLPIYLRFLTAHETYYPFGAHQVVIINTPTAFQVVLNLVRPVMSQAMKDSLIVFSSNTAEWKKYILSSIPGDQLFPHFGGTKSL